MAAFGPAFAAAAAAAAFVSAPGSILSYFKRGFTCETSLASVGMVCFEIHYIAFAISFALAFAFACLLPNLKLVRTLRVFFSFRFI